MPPAPHHMVVLCECHLQQSRECIVLVGVLNLVSWSVSQSVPASVEEREELGEFLVEVT